MSPCHLTRDGGCDGPEASSRVLGIWGGVRAPLPPVLDHWILGSKASAPVLGQFSRYTETMRPYALIPYGSLWVVNAG